MKRFFEWATAHCVTSLIIFIAASHLAHAEAAFASGKSVGRTWWGVAVNHHTRAEADAAALQQCAIRGPGCEINLRFAKSCYAVAVQINGPGFYVGIRPTLADSQTGAVQLCNARYSACRLDTFACDNVSEQDEADLHAHQEAEAKAARDRAQAAKAQAESDFKARQEDLARVDAETAATNRQRVALERATADVQAATDKARAELERQKALLVKASSARDNAEKERRDADAALKEAQATLVRLQALAAEASTAAQVARESTQKVTDAQGQLKTLPQMPAQVQSTATPAATSAPARPINEFDPSISKYERPPDARKAPDSQTLERSLAECVPPQNSGPFTLPGRGGKDIVLDGCFRGRKAFDCQISVITGEAKAILGDYTSLAFSNYKSVPDIQAVCKLDPAVLKKQLGQSKLLEARVTPLKKAFQDQVQCLNKVRDSLSGIAVDVDDPGGFIKQSKAQWDQIVKSAGDAFAEVENQFRDITMSQAAISEFSQIGAALCSSDSEPKR